MSPEKEKLPATSRINPIELNILSSVLEELEYSPVQKGVMGLLIEKAKEDKALFPEDFSGIFQDKDTLSPKKIKERLMPAIFALNKRLRRMQTGFFIQSTNSDKDNKRVGAYHISKIVDFQPQPTYKQGEIHVNAGLQPDSTILMPKAQLFTIEDVCSRIGGKKYGTASNLVLEARKADPSIVVEKRLVGKSRLTKYFFTGENLTKIVNYIRTKDQAHLRIINKTNIRGPETKEGKNAVVLHDGTKVPGLNEKGERILGLLAERRSDGEKTSKEEIKTAYIAAGGDPDVSIKKLIEKIREELRPLGFDLINHSSMTKDAAYTIERASAEEKIPSEPTLSRRRSKLRQQIEDKAMLEILTKIQEGKDQEISPHLLIILSHHLPKDSRIPDFFRNKSKVVKRDVLTMEFIVMLTNAIRSYWHPDQSVIENSSKERRQTIKEFMDIFANLRQKGFTIQQVISKINTILHLPPGMTNN